MGIIRTKYYRRPRFRPSRAGLAHAEKRGFTIVELLIVIVVIGILAAITIVAYTGVTQKANQAAAQSAAESAAKKVLAYMSLNSDQVPADLATAGVPTAGLQFSSNNSSTPRTFCITATSGNQSIYVDNGTHTTPTSGACPGHGAGGVVAINNLASDPRGTASPIAAGTGGWTSGRWGGGSPAAASYSAASGSGPVGISTFLRKTWTSAPGGIAATNDTGFNNSGTGTSGIAVSAGDVYTVSCYVRPSVVRNFMISVYQYNPDGSDFSTSRDFGGPQVTGPANAWTRVSYSYTVPAGVAFVFVSCDSTASTTGGAQNWAVGSTLDGTGLMITKGSTLYNYADGNSAGWAWSGLINNSTSSGPPL